MGACARNMQSDSAEIKPAQCCIKLVFHLTEKKIVHFPRNSHIFSVSIWMCFTPLNLRSFNFRVPDGSKLKGVRAFSFISEICFAVDNQGFGEGRRVDVKYSHQFFEYFKDGLKVHFYRIFSDLQKKKSLSSPKVFRILQFVPLIRGVCGRKRWSTGGMIQNSVSQPPGRGPVPGPGIKYTGPREVLLEFVI